MTRDPGAHLLVFTKRWGCVFGFWEALGAKNPPAHAGDTGLIPGPGGSPEVGNGKSLQHSCLGNLMDRGTGRLQSMEPQRVRHN